MDPKVETYADILRPDWARTRSHAWPALVYDASLIAGGSLLVALAAQVAIRLPFSPVPVTGQTLAVLLVGALLGSRRGALSLLAYLLEGLAGLPVFAAGASGFAYAMGPTGGYLVGFVAAAFVVGWLAERGWDRRLITAVVAMVVGNVAIYACGLPWLSTFVGKQAPALGLAPFVTGDVLKLVLAAIVLPAGWKLLPSQSTSRGG
jgi:biotin transport system substrate-specific component